MTKEERKLYMKLYREKHKEILAERVKKWQSQHPESIKDAGKKYRLKNYERLHKGVTERMKRTAYAPNHHKSWTSEEERFIISNHRIMTIYDIAIKLNRSENAVFIKLNRLRKANRI